jgi:hypothetical protein
MYSLAFAAKVSSKYLFMVGLHKKKKNGRKMSSFFIFCFFRSANSGVVAGLGIYFVPNWI